MNKKQAAEILRLRLREYVENLTKQHGGANTYDCPLCGSGKGAHGTPAFNIDPTGEKWKCFSCDAGGDLFDLIGAQYDIQDFTQQLEIAADYFGVTLDDQQRDKPTRKEAARHNAPVKEAAPEKDFTVAIEAAHAALLNNPAALKHFRDRGFTDETIKAAKLGYCEGGYNAMLDAKTDTKHMSKSKKAALYRYIIPYFDAAGVCRYFAAEIADRAQIDDYNSKYKKITELQAPPFNHRYITQPNPPKIIFLCEGYYDALSVEQAGQRAIALTGTGWRRVVQLINKHEPESVFVIVPDNDEPGRKAAETLAAELKKIGAAFTISAPETGKDCNEAMQGYPAGFAQWVANAADDAARVFDYYEQEKTAEVEAQRAEYAKTSAANYIGDFIDGITASANTPFLPTGFDKLDEILDGGLYPGLYVLGAVSSLGKSTFMLQIADQIAANGHDVLIFSLEMARTELMAKSISRLTLLDVMANNGNLQHAKTCRGITTGSRYPEYSDAEMNVIGRSIEEYSKYAGHIFIHEGIGDVGAAEIVEAVQRHVYFTGAAPVVLVDYVQILAPADVRASDKQNMDKAVLELKRLSRDYQTPVITVSSLNRDNYEKRISMRAFKESGAIEYGSDVLLGMQFKGTGNADFDMDKAKQKSPREIELVILKNRNGATGATIEYEYHPLFNYFREVGKVAKPAAAKVYSC